EFRAQLDRIDVELTDLPGVRDKVKSGNDLATTDVVFRYRTLVADLLSIRDASASLSGSEDIGSDMRAASSISSAKESLSDERVVVLRALVRGSVTAAVKREFIATLTGQEQALQTYNAAAQPDQRALYAQPVTGTDLRQAAKHDGAIEALIGGKLPS